jgi:hypothetical protein
MKSFKKTMLKERTVVAWVLVIMIAAIFLHPIAIPVQISPSVRAWYGFVNTLGPTSKPVLVSVDYTTGTRPEAEPALTVVTKDLIKHGVDLVFVGFGTPDATSLMQAVLNNVGIQKTYKYGVNYVAVGYIPGGEIAIATLGAKFQDVAKADAYGTPTASLQLTSETKDAADFSAVFDFDTTYTFVFWVRNWVVPYKVMLFQWEDASDVPSLTGYIRVGQIAGWMGGIPGAAQYEVLSGFVGDALKSTDVLSVTHITLILLIVAGNILYFTRSKRGQKKES